MRVVGTTALVLALGASSGCVSSNPYTGCYEVSSSCTVACVALPGQSFNGNIKELVTYVSGVDPGAIPVSTINELCRSGASGPLEAAPCFSATPPPDRQASITCNCTSWTVVDPNAACP